MTYNRTAFSDYTLLDTPIQVATASGATIPAIAEGSVQLKIALGGSIKWVTLTRVLHVPKLAGNLLSVVQLQDREITIRTTTGGKLLLERYNTVVGTAIRVGKAYVLENTLE